MAHPAKTLFAVLPILAAMAVPAAGLAASLSAEDLYERGKQDFYELKHLPQNRWKHHNVQKVLHSFDRVVAAWPDDALAPKALFTNGNLAEEMARLSGQPNDWQIAQEYFSRLAAKYPKSMYALAAGKHLATLAKKTGSPLPKAELAMVVPAKKAERPAKTPVMAVTEPVEEAPDTLDAAQTIPDPEANALPPDRTRSETLQTIAQLSESGSIDGQLEDDRSEVLKALLEEVKSKNGKRGPTLSEMMGLQVRRIIIDPGHGGEDPGALGPQGIKEKDVTLAVAKKLVRRLSLEPGIEVFLTRKKDKTLTLADRVKFANEHHGDLFISIHCNAHPDPSKVGIATYYLNNATDEFSVKLSRRENQFSGGTLSNLEFVLLDLVTSANIADSIRLAEQVQKNLYGKVTRQQGDTTDRGVKGALFYVLFSKMPSILVETSFLTNPIEEQRLKTAAFQETLADGLAQGIRNFMANRMLVAAP